MSANVLEYPAVASLERGSSTSHVADQASFQVSSREGVGHSQERLGSRDLYPLLEEEDSVVGAAMRMLDRIVDHLRLAALSGTLVDSDTELMKSRILLSRAFLHRDSLGQGYAAIVNGATWALANASVKVPSQKQILALKSILETLRNRPYLRFESAMILMDDLESEGFEIEPPSLDDLLVDDHV